MGYLVEGEMGLFYSTYVVIIKHNITVLKVLETIIFNIQLSSGNLAKIEVYLLLSRKPSKFAGKIFVYFRSGCIALALYTREGKLCSRAYPGFSATKLRPNRANFHIFEFANMTKYCWEHQAGVIICLFWVWLAVLRNSHWLIFSFIFSSFKPEFTWILGHFRTF